MGYTTYDPLGDGISSLVLVDHMGSDLSVVNAARVSFGKRSETLTAKDERLIAYLERNHHDGPFEHVVFTFRVRAPLFVVQQWERHRTGAFNEESGRYITLRDDFYTPAGVTERQEDQMKLHWRKSFAMYSAFIEQGMEKERARIVLPASLYKELIWTVNARNLAHFIKLRADEHAQWEIRKYAEALKEIFAQVTPTLSTALFLNGRKAP